MRQILLFFLMTDIEKKSRRPHFPVCLVYPRATSHRTCRPGDTHYARLRRLKRGPVYLHGARLAAADHGGAPLDADGLGEGQGLVGLVLGQVLQTALVGLLLFVLIGHKVTQRRLETDSGHGHIRDS